MALPRVIYSDNLKNSLFEAVEKNNIKLMQQLMPSVKELYDTDLIALRNENNQSLLHIALKNRAYNAYVCLFNACKSEEKFEETLTCSDNNNRSLLWYSVNCNNLNLVKQLLPFYKKLHINNVNGWLTADNQGTTLLHLAAEHINGKMLTFLINEIDEKNNIINLINLYDNKRNTPLHLASMSKSTPNIISLLQMGAAVYLQNEKGDTFLSSLKKSPDLFSGYTVGLKILIQIIRHLTLQAKNQPDNEELQQLILLFTCMKGGVPSSQLIDNIESIAITPPYVQIEKDKKYLLELIEKLKEYQEYLASDDAQPYKKFTVRLEKIQSVIQKIFIITGLTYFIGLILIPYITAHLLAVIISSIVLVSLGLATVSLVAFGILKVINAFIPSAKFQLTETLGMNGVFDEIEKLLATLTAPIFVGEKNAIDKSLHDIHNNDLLVFEVDYELEKIVPHLNKIIDIMYQSNMSITAVNIPVSDSPFAPEQLDFDEYVNSNQNASTTSYAGYKGTLLPAPDAKTVKEPLKDINIEDIRPRPVY